MKVNFYDKVDDCLLKFAVVIAEYKDNLVLCKHKDRNTYEIPGGHRENNEAIEKTAKENFMRKPEQLILL